MQGRGARRLRFEQFVLLGRLPAADYARRAGEAFLANNRKAPAALQGKPKSTEPSAVAAVRASLSEIIRSRLKAL